MASYLPEKGLTFDDVLLVPAYSEVSLREIDLKTWFSRNVTLNIPLSSAAMDTVTEARLAIAIAQEGGIGVIHRNLSIEKQALEVDKVKRSENGVITDPITLGPEDSIQRAKEIMDAYHISGLPIVVGGKLVGIFTNRDLRFQEDLDRPVKEVMTKSPLITAPVGTTIEEAKRFMMRHKVEKLPLTDEEGYLKGLITIKDIIKMEQFPNASKDERGRLRVGAAVGVMDIERAEALSVKGCDVLVVDSAHGHSRNVIETVRMLKKRLSQDIVAGNVATREGARALIEAGADGIKIGMGPGSICTTRVIAGIGVPQITAIMECAEVADEAGVPLIADGGIKFSGDITKALAAGAESAMLGALLAGTEESPGEIVIYQGRSFKEYRGMGSILAMQQGSMERYGQERTISIDKLVAEGIEGRVPFKGPLSAFIQQLIGGIKSGMGYLGARDIQNLRRNARFMRITNAGLREGHPHDIQITKEAPNYRLEW